MSIIIVGKLGARSLSAQVVAYQTVMFLYNIAASLHDAGNILIGQYLGANKPQEANNAKNVVYTLAMIIIMIYALFILLTHRWLPFLFNIPMNSLPLAEHVLLLIGIVVIFDGFTLFQTGVAKGW